MRQSKRVDGLPSDGPARRTRARYLSDDDPPLQTVVSAASPASETPPIRRSPVLLFSMTIFHLSQRHHKIIRTFLRS